MKRTIILIILAGWFIFPALSQNPPQDKNWKVVFQDDFDTLNTQRWKIEYGPCAPGNGPDESVQFRTFQNTFVENGKLVLRTKKENHQCNFGNCRYPNNIHPYTSGEVVSYGPYHYGYYEMYAKLPSCHGFSPGFWFWDSRNNPIDGCWYHEINVIEVNTCWSDAYEVGIHAHYPSNCDDLDNRGEYNTVKCTYGDGYHWYGLEWNRDRVIWYLDRKIVWQELNNLEVYGVQHPMENMILGVGLRDTEEPNKCAIPDNATFPKDMLVDQVNVYRLKCNKNTVVNEISNFNTFNYAVKKSITMSNATAIPSGSNISLRATDFIELKAGFEVQTGRELYLDVTPCDDPDCCLDYLTDQTITSNTTVTGCDMLLVQDVEISNSAQVVITAGEKVSIKSGFHAQAGTNVKISIVP